MPKLRVHAFGISLDGYGAGPGQDLQNPLGAGGLALHDWIVPTRTFRQMHGGEQGGAADADDEFAARGFAGIGAWIMGRNMFGPTVGRGRTAPGRDGGATTLLITHLSSCSRTMLERPS